MREQPTAETVTRCQEAYLFFFLLFSKSEIGYTPQKYSVKDFFCVSWVLCGLSLVWVEAARLCGGGAVGGEVGVCAGGDCIASSGGADCEFGRESRLFVFDGRSVAWEDLVWLDLGDEGKRGLSRSASVGDFADPVAVFVGGAFSVAMQSSLCDW